MPQHFLKKIFLLSCFLIISQPTMARWATPLDADEEIESSISKFYVYKDGTSRSNYQLKTKILKEPAKTRWSKFSLRYNTVSNTYKIIEATTITNNKRYSVQPDQIEDKPIASDSQSFDQINQITLAYPKVSIGSQTVLTYEVNEHKVPLTNTYAELFTFSDDSYTKSREIHIRSEIPLAIKKHDPDQLIQITQKTIQENNKPIYLLDIIQTKPSIKAIVDENYNQPNPKNLTFVEVSSIKDWKTIGRQLALDYEQIKAQPLPTVYQEIVDIAKKQKTTLDKINTVTALVADKLTYLSDMRTIKGQLIAQPLANIAKTRLGDCKDFSMATAVILQALGIPSEFALVARKENYQALPTQLPGLYYFNHIIITLKLNNERLWIDPTNFVSMAPHVFPDIADRMALILDVNHSYVAQIPAITFAKTQMISRETWNLHDLDQVSIKGTLYLQGNLATDFTGAQKNRSDASLKNHIIQILGHANQAHNYTVTLPDLSSRIVKDQTFDYTINARMSTVKTNAGIAILIPFSFAETFILKKDTVSDVYLGFPFTADRYLTLDYINVVGGKSLDYHLQSPWADLKRTVVYEKNKAHIHQQVKIKKSWITATELQSTAYKNFQLAIEQNLNHGMAIIFQPTVNAGT